MTLLGRNLKELRRKEKMLLLEFSKKLNSSPSFISQIESGLRTMPDDMVQKTAHIFKLSTKEIKKWIAIDSWVKNFKTKLENVNFNNKEDMVAFAREIENDADLVQKINLINKQLSLFHGSEKNARE